MPEGAISDELLSILKVSLIQEVIHREFHVPPPPPLLAPKGGVFFKDIRIQVTLCFRSYCGGLTKVKPVGHR